MKNVAYEKDLFDLKMETHLQTTEEARNLEVLKKKREIPMLTEMEAEWQRLSRHELKETDPLL